MIPGYVYVMSNASLNGLVKVGMSLISPHEIALSSSKCEFIPDEFIVDYYLKVYNLFDAEAIVRSCLHKFHYKKDFYNINKENAIKIINNANLKQIESYLKNSNSNIIELNNGYYIETKNKVALKKFYNELKNIKKLIKNFPIRSENYLIYTTYHIEESYRSLLNAYKEININEWGFFKQQKEISLVHEKMLNCIKLKNEQKNKYVKIEI